MGRASRLRVKGGYFEIDPQSWWPFFKGSAWDSTAIHAYPNDLYFGGTSMLRIRLNRSITVCLFLAIAGMFARGSGAYGGNIGLGFGWSSSAPDGYQLNANKTLVDVKTTPTVLVQENATWATLKPITVNFFRTNKSQVPDRGWFSLTMNVTNATNVGWQGFLISIVDGAKTDYPNPAKQEGGSLLHPDRAHFHVDNLNPAQLGFTTIIATTQYYNGKGLLVTDNEGLDTQGGVYFIAMMGGLIVKPGAKWNPMIVGSQLLIHDKPRSPFSVTFQPIPVTPDPATLALMTVAGAALMLTPRHRRARRTLLPNHGAVKY